MLAFCGMWQGPKTCAGESRRGPIEYMFDSVASVPAGVSQTTEQMFDLLAGIEFVVAP